MSSIYSQPKGRRYKTPTVTHQLVQATGTLRTIIAEGTLRTMYRAVVQLARRLGYAHPKSLANAAKTQAVNQNQVLVHRDPRTDATYLIQEYRRTKLIALKIAKGALPKNQEYRCKACSSADLRLHDEANLKCVSCNAITPIDSGDARLQYLMVAYNDVINGNLYESNKAAWLAYMRSSVPINFRSIIAPHPHNDANHPWLPTTNGVWQENTATGQIVIDNETLAPHAEDVRRRLGLLAPPMRTDYRFDLAQIAIEQPADIVLGNALHRTPSKGTNQHVTSPASRPSAVKAIKAMIPNTRFSIPGIKIYTATTTGPAGPDGRPTEIPLQVYSLGPQPVPPPAADTGFDKYMRYLLTHKEPAEPIVRRD